MIRGIATGFGLVAVLALVGCAPTATAAQHTQAAGSTPTQTPTVTPTPTPTQPSLAELVISPDGLGPLQVGQPVTNQSGSTAVVTWSADACAATNPTDYRGAWLPNYPKTGEKEISNPNRAVFTFNSKQMDSPIDFIAVWSPEIKTAEGVGIGSTPAQLTAAYGSKLAVTHTQNSDIYSLQGTSGTLLFEVPTKPDTSRLHVWSTADLGKVIWLDAFAGTVTPFTMSGNQVLGSCFVRE